MSSQSLQLLSGLADVNECSKQDICGVGGQCVNLPGSYKCECHSGFRNKSPRQPVCEGTEAADGRGVVSGFSTDATLIMSASLASLLHACVSVLRVHAGILCGKSKHVYVRLLLTYSRHKRVFESRDLPQRAVREHAGLLRVCPLPARSRGPGWHLLR